MNLLQSKINVNRQFAEYLETKSFPSWDLKRDRKEALRIKQADYNEAVYIHNVLVLGSNALVHLFFKRFDYL